MKRAAYVLVAGALLAGLVATCAPPTPEVPEQVSPVSPMSTPTETPRPTTAGTSPTETRTPTEAPTPTRTPEPTITPRPTPGLEVLVEINLRGVERVPEGETIIAPWEYDKIIWSEYIPFGSATHVSIGLKPIDVDFAQNREDEPEVLIGGRPERIELVRMPVLIYRVVAQQSIRVYTRLPLSEKR